MPGGSNDPPLAGNVAKKLLPGQGLKAFSHVRREARETRCPVRGVAIQRKCNGMPKFAQAISPTSSLFVAQRSSINPRGTWRNFGETRGGWEKVAFWSTKAAISLKRVKREES